MEIIGLDIGFGFTKATNGQRTVLFKSVLGEAADIQYREQIVGGTASQDHLHLEVDGAQYFAGDLAERQSANRSFTLDHNKLMSDFAKRLALAAISELSTGKEALRVVAGLPINQYRRQREGLVKTLQGSHQVGVIDEKGNRREVNYNVQQVRVIPQPFGTLFNLAFGSSGEVKQRQFAEQKVGLIDVGFRTTDLAISDHTRFSERASRTVDAGISQAFGSIAAKLQEKSGVNVELYRLYEAVGQGSIRIRGQGYDLRSLTDKVLGELAASIGVEVDRLWADDWDIDTIVLTGGGGAVLQPHLAPLIAGDLVTADSEPDPRLANVAGYLKYGKNVWGRAERTAQEASEKAAG